MSILIFKLYYSSITNTLWKRISHTKALTSGRDRANIGQGSGQDQVRTGSGPDKDRVRTGQGSGQDRVGIGSGSGSHKLDSVKISDLCCYFDLNSSNGRWRCNLGWWGYMQLTIFYTPPHILFLQPLFLMCLFSPLQLRHHSPLLHYTAVITSPSPLTFAAPSFPSPPLSQRTIHRFRYDWSLRHQAPGADLTAACMSLCA